MWKKEHTVLATVSKESVWLLWSDVRHWNLWDHAVESSGLDGEFKPRSKGWLKMVGKKKNLEFLITECSPGAGFTVEFKLPFCRMEFIHRMKDSQDSKLSITHSLRFSGILGFIYGPFLGRKLFKYIPDALNNLVEHAEEKHIPRAA